MNDGEDRLSHFEGFTNGVFRHFRASLNPAGGEAGIPGAVPGHACRYVFCESAVDTLRAGL